MSMRTTETSVTFRHPFLLSSLDDAQPAGVYRLVIDEEEILGLSFIAFRRVATTLHVPAVTIASRSSRAILIDQGELARVLAGDEADQDEGQPGKELR